MHGRARGGGRASADVPSKPVASGAASRAAPGRAARSTAFRAGCSVELHFARADHGSSRGSRIATAGTVRASATAWNRVASVRAESSSEILRGSPLGSHLPATARARPRTERCTGWCTSTRRPFSLRRAPIATETARCASSSASCGSSSPAASSRAASPASAATSVVPTCWSRSPARDAASARRARGVAWRASQHSSCTPYSAACPPAVGAHHAAPAALRARVRPAALPARARGVHPCGAVLRVTSSAAARCRRRPRWGRHRDPALRVGG